MPSSRMSQAQSYMCSLIQCSHRLNRNDQCHSVIIGYYTDFFFDSNQEFLRIPPLTIYYNILLEIYKYVWMKLATQIDLQPIQVIMNGNKTFLFCKHEWSYCRIDLLRQTCTRTKNNQRLVNIFILYKSFLCLFICLISPSFQSVFLDIYLCHRLQINVTL